MYLLDTNVISALRVRRSGTEPVWIWASGNDASDHYLSAITVLELEVGVLRTERRDPLQGRVYRDWLSGQVLPTFSGRIFPVDTSITLRCARLHVPDPSPDLDSLIAATALVHDLTVVTRNTRDFVRSGVRTIDPWDV